VGAFAVVVAAGAFASAVLMWRDAKPELAHAIRVALTVAGCSSVLASLAIWITRRSWSRGDPHLIAPTARPVRGLAMALLGIGVFALGPFVSDIKMVNMLGGLLLFLGGCGYAVTGQWMRSEREQVARREESLSNDERGRGGP